MASPNPYGTNAFGVKSPKLDYSKFPNSGQYTTMTYHGGTIIVGDSVIGRIKEWTPGQFTRQVNHVREVSSETWGLPVDAVPGISEGFNIAFTKTEVWQQELEIAFGLSANPWTSLSEQTAPFEAKEYLFRGLDVYRTWVYNGCWFTEKNPNAWSSTGDGIIEVGCNMIYVNRQRTT